jgi:hypothetical protein
MQCVVHYCTFSSLSSSSPFLIPLTRIVNLISKVKNPSYTSSLTAMSSLFSPSELSYTSHPLLTPSLTRSDARSPTSFRPISLSTSISNNTLGSSKVSVSSALGGGVTEVWAGVRGEVEDCVEGGGGRVVVAVEW